MISFREFCKLNEEEKYEIRYDTNPTGAFGNTITVTKQEFEKVKAAYDSETAQKSGFNKFIITDNKIELGYNPTRHLIDKQNAKVMNESGGLNFKKEDEEKFNEIYKALSSEFKEGKDFNVVKDKGWWRHIELIPSFRGGSTEAMKMAVKMFNKLEKE